MKLSELIAEYRAEAVDDVEPYLTSDALLKVYAAQGQDEACRRGRLLRDSSADFCSIDVTAGAPIIDVDARVIDVVRARLASQADPLEPITVVEIDERAPGWEEDVGEPRAIVTDYTANKLRLWPSPRANDVLRLTVVRLPMTALAADADEPELRLEHQRALVQWMLFRAFSRPDADFADPQRASIALGNFEREFGNATSARNEQWMRERHLGGADPIA